jgi:hypothetical protein
MKRQVPTVKASTPAAIRVTPTACVVALFRKWMADAPLTTKARAVLMYDSKVRSLARELRSAAK